MRIVAHLSDLHFGRTDAKVVNALLHDLQHMRPDLVIVSGDLTQRARSHQFAEARAFLSHCPAPASTCPATIPCPCGRTGTLWRWAWTAPARCAGNPAP
jgi:hypothetical protein